MRATLVHSPGAGYDRCTRQDLLDAFTAAGFDVVYCTLDDDVEAVLDAPGDLVVVAGGDGTAGHVASHLVGRNVPLGLLPLGTANNLCRELGLVGAPAELIRRWGAASPQPFDTGVANGPWGQASFVETAGLGLFAELLPVLSAHKKANDVHFDDADEEVRHDLAALRERLETFPARTIRFTVDGETREERLLLLEVMNIGYLGPNLHLAPEADPGDGLFDVVTVGEDEREALTAHLDALLDGAEPPHRFTTRRARRVGLTWDGHPLHVDAATWADRTCDLPKCRRPDVPPPAPVELRIHPGALALHRGD